MILLLLIGLLILIANVTFQDTVGSLHPITWLVEVGVIYTVLHLVNRLINRIR